MKSQGLLKIHFRPNCTLAVKSVNYWGAFTYREKFAEIVQCNEALSVNINGIKLTSDFFSFFEGEVRRNRPGAFYTKTHLCFKEVLQ